MMLKTDLLPLKVFWLRKNIIWIEIFSSFFLLRSSWYADIHSIICHATKEWWCEGIASGIRHLTTNHTYCLASHLSHYTPGKTTPETNCTGCWVGFRIRLDVMAERNILCWGSNTSYPACMHL
jgi:hypothetical protein